MTDGLLNDLLGLIDGFWAARENRDCLIHLMRLLHDCEPSLLLLGDKEKRLMAADDSDKDHPEETESLTQELIERCPAQGIHVFDIANPTGLRLGFGVRLPAEAEHGILAGLVRHGKQSERFIVAAGDMLTAYGSLAMVACRSKADKRLLQTQIEHLVAERDVLRMSHSEAITVAVAEREQRLREQQEHVGRLQAVMMTAADGLITFSETGTIESFNEAAGCIFGYEPSEAIGQNIAILLPTSECNPGEHPPPAVSLTTKDASANATREVIGRRQDGSTFPLELAVSEVSLDDRRIRTAILRDITARKQAEEQLQRLHVQNNAILNSAGEGIVGTDRHGKAVFANPAGALMLGWGSTDLVGQQMDTLFHRATRDKEHYLSEESLIRKTLRDGVQRRADHEIFSRQDGSRVPMEYTMTPIWEEGEIVGGVLTFR
ncbi:MAG TPA: PAS domain S-box protein, partial [Thermoguttaceae bacterium]|nr:PAS domain S-box protein [Thermoguttaceae bacterium]